MGIIAVEDWVKRKSRLADEAKASDKQEMVSFRGEDRPCAVLRLPIGLPLYRMQNGRTRVKQIEMERDRQLSLSFFTHGEENLESQLAQHKILLEMSKDPKGNIYQELESKCRQTKTLLITATGVTVDGNRRLAAMRELHASDPTTYAGFGHVNVAVLPPEATAEDIETIEAELQLVPETKLDYGWIERRLSLRHKLNDLRMTKKRIKDIFRFQREEDINVELGQLGLAEQYLEEFLKKPLAYEDVEKSFQLFRELQISLAGKKGEEAEVRRNLGFVLIKESRNLGETAYRFRSAFGADFRDFVDEFSKCTGITPPVDGKASPLPVENGKTVVGDDDPLTGLEEAPAGYQPIIDLLADSAKSGEVAETVVDVMGSIKSSQREQDAKRAPLKAVQEALRRLSDVDLGKADPSTFSAIIGQLDGIIRRAKELREKVKEKKNAGG